MKKILLFLSIGAMILVAGNAFALQISWTDWTAATAGTAGSATGTIGGTIGVGYTGDISFAQLGSGINYWTEGDPAPYTGNAIVDNAPTASEMIALSSSGILNTLTFSQVIYDPIMTIVSLGRYGLPVSYDFDRSFTVLSEGRGYWGDGWYNILPGDVLQGYELHAAIQFEGAVSSISWTASPNEYWHGITVGVSGETPVPEPATMFLLASGLIGLAGVRRRFKKG